LGPTRPLGLPPRRDGRDAAWNVDEVGVIREARNDADLAVYAALWSGVRPGDAVSAEFVRGHLWREPERLYLLAEHDGRAVGCGGTAESSVPGRTSVAVGVVPERRRRGLGSALLERCLDHARSLG